MRNPTLILIVIVIVNSITTRRGERVWACLFGFGLPAHLPPPPRRPAPTPPLRTTLAKIDFGRSSTPSDTRLELPGRGRAGSKAGQNSAEAMFSSRPYECPCLVTAGVERPKRGSAADEVEHCRRSSTSICVSINPRETHNMAAANKRTSCGGNARQGAEGSCNCVLDGSGIFIRQLARARSLSVCL